MPSCAASLRHCDCCVWHRVNSLARPLLLNLLHVLSARPCHVAGSLPPPVLQSQETDRVVHSLLLPSDDSASKFHMSMLPFFVGVSRSLSAMATSDCIPVQSVACFHWTHSQKNVSCGKFKTHKLSHRWVKVHDKMTKVLGKAQSVWGCLCKCWENPVEYVKCNCRSECIWVKS